ncbi:MAG: DUF1326 domain-containing protein [Proteobacteria bacterium]|nr:DUF1326 domain-containing protein [Pseudomonadota bacterium]
MAWNISGRGLEICSCKTFCPCWLTADVEPDEGWCSAVFAWDSKEGRADGVDLAGVKFALVTDWPGNFHKGGGKGRLYVDSATNANQQAELRAIFEGKKEGPVPALWSAAIDEWLPLSVVDISIDWNQKKVAVANVGEATMKSLTDAAGNQTHMYNSLAQVAFGIDRMDLMTVEGKPWADPDLRNWKVADGVNFEFAWAG